MTGGFLIDMDGVIYRGHELIPGADRFVRRLREFDIPFLFLTNNSQRTRRDVVAKLQPMGIEVEERHVFTCAMATARFLAQQKPSGTAFVIGEGGLLHALHQNGYAIVDDNPDYVVVGEGRTFTMEMLERAVNMIKRRGQVDRHQSRSQLPDQRRRTPAGLRGDRRASGSRDRREGVQRGQAQPRDDAGRPQRVGAFDRGDDDHRRHDGNRHPGRRATGLSHGAGPLRRHPPPRPRRLRLPPRLDFRLRRQPGTALGVPDGRVRAG